MEYIPLRLGAFGPAVQQVQKTLEDLGYTVGAIDGRFGLRTQGAVFTFQSDHELPIDGVVAKNTWEAMEQDTGEAWIIETARPLDALESPPAVREEEAVQIREAASGAALEAPPVATVSLFPWTAVPQEVETAVEAAPAMAPPEPEPAPPEKAEAEAEQPVRPPEPGTGPTQTLAQGSRDGQVASLQRRLGTYYTGAVTGYFGALTSDALIRFQRERGLPATGVADEKTMEMLQMQRDRQEDARPTIEEIIVLRPGASGSDVASLQRLLQKLGYYTGAIDGVYGGGTTIAVERFQRANGLLDDGIAGPATLALLTEQAGEEDGLGDQVFPQLREGDTGQDVRVLQGRLKQLDLFAPSVTGSFGPVTTASVKQFQKDVGLPETGVVDTSTWDALIKLTAPPIDVLLPPHGSTRPIIRYGDTGDDVLYLQERLQELMYYLGELNSVFDGKTQVAVKSFQDVNRLTPDGVVGPLTWNALITLDPPPIICD